MDRAAAGAVGAAAASTVALAYSAGVEVRAFQLRRIDVPVLPAGSAPLRVLHISDLHLVPRQGRKRAWLNGLADLEPDLVVNTGDTIADREAVPAVVDALEPLLELPGVFVFGSNDYFAPAFKNPARYLLPTHRHKRVFGPKLPWPALREAFLAAGWVDLNNSRTDLTVDGRLLSFAGVDDPHLGYDRYEMVAGVADSRADLTIGVAHAPYLRVLDAFVADGYRLVLAGHTHGGQLRLPVKGALVTNCDLDTGRARGLSRHPKHDAGGAWLHVSAGLGTSPYAPVRFCCPPEATLLTLRAAG